MPSHPGDAGGPRGLEDRSQGEAGARATRLLQTVRGQTPRLAEQSKATDELSWWGKVRPSPPQPAPSEPELPFGVPTVTRPSPALPGVWRSR